jgi:hypothetical protein
LNLVELKLKMLKRQMVVQRKVRSSQPEIAQVGTYSGLDQNTGGRETDYRKITTLDGGTDFVRHTANSTPKQVPDLYIRGSLGRPGIIGSRNA